MAVWWNEDEKKIVQERYLAARKAGKDKLGALREAQSILPSERRRTISLNWKINFRKILNEWESNGATKQDNTVVVPTVVQIEIPVQPHVEVVIARIATSLLIANLCERFFGYVERVTTGYLGSKGKTLPPAPVLHPVPSYTSVLPPIKRERPVRIAIVGLLKEQFNRVQEKVNGKAELLFIDKEWSKTAFPSKVDHIICTRHVEHRWTETANVTVPRDRAHWCTGETDIVQTIYDVTAQQV